jgi:hypothetical protein
VFARVPRLADRELLEHWLDFIRRLSRLPDEDGLAREVAEYVLQRLHGTSAAVYLAERGQAAYRLRAETGNARFTSTIQCAGTLLPRLPRTAVPVALPAQLLPALSVPVLSTALAAPIQWRDTVLGFIVLGSPRTRTEHDVENLALFQAIAQQSAAPIVAARLSQDVFPDRIEDLDTVTTAAIHDIKNSVSALSLLVRNAARNFSDPEFQHDAITTLTRTVQRMQRLLARLSSPSLASPARPVNLEPVDLQALIVEATMPLATDPRVRLVRRLDPVPSVLAERDALLRVVENLVTNAAEAIGEHGMVTVTLTAEHGSTVISVADTGCGIPTEYRERHLFSLFRSTKTDGWGVGLYHTRQIVERHGGTIRVDSAEGLGTTVAVTLPLGAPVEDASREGMR